MRLKAQAKLIADLDGDGKVAGKVTGLQLSQTQAQADDQQEAGPVSHAEKFGTKLSSGA
ncbi:hypothetical protein [Candidatus Electronema sp. PJ]|uniref:hypothetical protein n=1 Tax=Candidatus Electronema sp. PJ TaxID=3401572 RepID=UPI003AA8F28F